MPYDPLQLKTDVDALIASPKWQDETTRKELIRQVGIDAKANLDPESHTQLMGELWGRAEPSLASKAATFTKTALEEVVKSGPAAGGAVAFGAFDLAGITNTGSGARLKAGWNGLVDTAKQRIKQLDPNDRQELRDGLIDSLKADLDAGAAPEGFERWLSGEYDNKDIDDPETKQFVDAFISSISRAGVAADKMGDIDAKSLDAFLQSDRNPARADSDIPGQAGARQFLADYVATRDPASWEAFKQRVSETESQYKNRLSTSTAQRPEAEATLAAMPEGLAKEMVGRSFSMQESPIDLATAALPILRGAKALQAARAGGSAVRSTLAGMAEEGVQEALTSYLEDPRNTAAQIAEAGALGAVGSGIIEGGMAGAGRLLRPSTIEGGDMVDVEIDPALTAQLDAKIREAEAKAAASPAAASPAAEQAPPLQQVVEETAISSVEANADVLPATAAALAEVRTPVPTFQESDIATTPEMEGDLLARVPLQTQRGGEMVTDESAPAVAEEVETTTPEVTTQTKKLPITSQPDVEVNYNELSQEEKDLQNDNREEDELTNEEISAKVRGKNKLKRARRTSELLNFLNENGIDVSGISINTHITGIILQRDGSYEVRLEHHTKTSIKPEIVRVRKGDSITKPGKLSFLNGVGSIVTYDDGSVVDATTGNEITPPTSQKPANETPVPVGQTQDGGGLSELQTPAEGSIPAVTEPSVTEETEKSSGETAVLQRDPTKPEQMTPEEVVEEPSQEAIKNKRKPIIRYKYKTPSEAGPFYGSMDAPEGVSVGDTIRAPFGEAQVTSKSKAGKLSAKEIQDIYEAQFEEAAQKRSNHRKVINQAITQTLPVSAAAIDAYGITIPEGYVREGDLYVYRQPAEGVGPETRIVPAIQTAAVQVEPTREVPADFIPSNKIARMSDTELGRRLSGLRLFMQGKMESGSTIGDAAMENVARLYQEARKRGLLEAEPTIDAYIARKAKPAHSPPPAQPAPAGQAEAAQARPPEQMTPEEWGEASKERQRSKLQQRKAELQQIIKVSSPDAVAPEERELRRIEQSLQQNEKWQTKDLIGSHPLVVEKALASNKPVSAAAVDAYGIALPEGYTLEGDLYVYRQPSSTDRAQAEPVSESQTPPSQKPVTEPETAEQSPAKAVKVEDQSKIFSGTSQEVKDSGAGVVFAISRGAKGQRYTLWIKVGNRRWDYIRTLPADKDEAIETAKESAAQVAFGEGASIAFVGDKLKAQIKEQVDKGVAVITDELNRRQLEEGETTSPASPIGEQTVGFGKHANTLVSELASIDPSYAVWLHGNATSKRGEAVAKYLERDPSFLAARDADKAQKEEMEAAARKFEDRNKPKPKPSASVTNTETNNVVNNPTFEKKTERKASEQVVDIIAPNETGDTLPPALKKHMFPMQVSGAEAAIESLDADGVFLNGDGAGVGKTRQIIAVASHYAKQGKPVIIITENAAIGKPWENPTKPMLGGSMAKDSAAMSVNLKLMPDGGAEAGQIYVTTYHRVQANQVPKGAVVIFDESQNLANVYGDISKETGNWKEKFGAIFPAASRIAFYSATPADKPHQLAYLYKALGFASPEEYLNAALDKGMLIRIRKFGKKEQRLYDLPKSTGARTKLFKWVNGLMKRAGVAGRFIKREISYEGTDVQFHDTKGTDMSANPWAEKFEDVLSQMRVAEQNNWRLLAPQSYVLYAAELTKIGDAVRMVKRELAAGRKTVLYFSRINPMKIRGRQMQIGPDGSMELSEPVDLGEIPSPVDLLREELKKEGIAFAELHGKSGDTSKRAQDKFSGDTDVLLASVESGGTGINLDDTTGNKPRTEVFMFAPYRGISTIQAMGRIWRASTVQNDNKPNRFVFIVASDILPDAQRSAVLAKKLQLMNASLGGTAVSRLPMSKVSYDPDQLAGIELPDEGEASAIGSLETSTDPLPAVNIKFTLSSSGKVWWAKANAQLLEWMALDGPERTGVDVRVKKDDRGGYVAFADRAYKPEDFAEEAVEEETTSLAETGPPVGEMKTSSVTTDQPAPISKRPSLGTTGKEIIDAWRSKQGTNVAPGETVVGWDVNGGGTYAFISDKLVRLRRDSKGFESSYTEATDKDWQDVSDSLDRGALQVEVRKITGLGGYQKVDAGKTVKVLHQATGRPLQEFLDTPEGASWQKRMDEAVAKAAPTPSVEAAPVTEPEAAQTPPAEPSPPEEPATTVEPPPPPQTTRLANETTNQERIARGEQPLETPEEDRYPWAKVDADTKAILVQDPRAGFNLVEELGATMRAVNPLESGLLLEEKAARRVDFIKAVDAFKEATTPEAKAQAEARMLEARKRLSAAEEIYRKVGTIEGQALAFRKKNLALDFSTPSMVADREAALRRPLTADEIVEVSKKSEEILKLTEEVEALNASEAAQEEAESIFEQMIKEIQEEDKARARSLVEQSKKAAKEGKSLKDFMVEKREEALKRIKARSSNYNAGLNPSDLIDHAIVAASYLAEGITSLVDLTKKMVEAFGEGVRQHMPKILREAEAIDRTEQELFSKPEEAEKSAIELLEESSGEIFSPSWVYKAVKEYVKKNGVKVPLDKILEDLVAKIGKNVPGVTVRSLRDAYTGYGKPRFPSDDVISKRLRELRSLGQYASKIEDVLKGSPPLRSGIQRDAASQAVREMSKRLNDLMKEHKVEYAPGKQAIKSPLDAVKTRLRNTLEDLEKQKKILEEGGVRETRTRKKVEYDEEAAKLSEQVKTLRDVLDKLEQPTPPTFEERVQTRLDTLDREIAELKRLKAEGGYAPTPQKAVITQEIQVKLDERAQLKDEIEAIRQLKEADLTLTQEEVNDLAEQRYTSQIAEIERQIRDKDFPTPDTGLKPQNTMELQRLKNRLKAVKAQRDELTKIKSAPKGKSQDQLIDEAAKALEKSIDNLNQRIIDGDIGVKGRTSKTPEVAKIKNLRAERDSLRDVLKQMRKAEADSKRDPIQEQFERDQKMIQRRIEYYEDKLRRKDFRPRTKKVREYDKRLLDKEQELESAQREWYRGQMMANLEARGWPAKLWDGIKETLYLMSSFFTSGDVGGILRQGGRATFSYPRKAASNLKSMLEVLKSDEKYRVEKKRLRERDNYPIYKRSGLFIAEDENASLSSQEEAYMGRLIEKVVLNAKDNPANWKKVATWLRNKVTAIPRASQRAHVTYLNKMRADIFDYLYDQLKTQKEVTQDDLNTIAYHANQYTGRGDLGKGVVSRAAPLVSTVIWTPRMLAANLQFLAQTSMWKTDPKLRKLIAKDLATVLTNYALVAGLGYIAYLAAGGDEEEEPYIEFDPRSSNFLQPKLGSKRVNYLGGLTQVVNYLARVGLGETKTASGEVRPLRDFLRPLDAFREVPLRKMGKMEQGIGATTYRFIRGRTTPGAGLAWDLATSRDFSDRPITPMEAVSRQLTPMMLNDIVQNLKESNIPEAAIDSILNGAGASVQHEFEKGPRKSFLEDVESLQEKWSE